MFFTYIAIHFASLNLPKFTFGEYIIAQYGWSLLEESELCSLFRSQVVLRRSWRLAGYTTK